MAEDIERALVEAETWQSIQAQPYDGERYPCGCHPHPKSPHIHFHLCDYHDGFDEGVYQGQHELHAERDASRLIINDLTAEVERLRAERTSLLSAGLAFQAEVERLRDLGDALICALENNLMATAVVLVNQWKEVNTDG